MSDEGHHRSKSGRARGSVRMFQRYIGIDYSGAKTVVRFLRWLAEKSKTAAVAVFAFTVTVGVLWLVGTAVYSATSTISYTLDAVSAWLNQLFNPQSSLALRLILFSAAAMAVSFGLAFLGWAVARIFGHNDDDEGD